MIWLLLFGALLLLMLAAVYYLVRGVHRFRFVSVLSRGRKAATWGISALIVLLAIALFGVTLGYMNAIIIFLHLAVFWALADLVQWIVKKVRKAPCRRCFSGAVALAVTIAYLAVGWVQAFHVWQTDYTIETEKRVGHLRVALLADSHVGTTFDGDGLARHLTRLQAQQPDVVVVAGDFVDEDTTEENMRAACRALGSLHAPYGVYYVFGNHDKGNYSNGRRGYSGDDLAAELSRNGVTVLQDETAPLGDHFYVIGRQDASEVLDFGGTRAEMGELVAGLDADRFAIVLDHQPRDYAAKAASGVDLVLSGHTHGGQMIPLPQLIRWFHLGDDQVYGMERRENTHFIVTSGISDWAIKFKTGCRSEYVIVDIEGKN